MPDCYPISYFSISLSIDRSSVTGRIAQALRNYDWSDLMTPALLYFECVIYRANTYLIATANRHSIQCSPLQWQVPAVAGPQAAVRSMH
jgi:hypothetical protein